MSFYYVVFHLCNFLNKLYKVNENIIVELVVAVIAAPIISYLGISINPIITLNIADKNMIFITVLGFPAAYITALFTEASAENTAPIINIFNGVEPGENESPNSV